MLPLNRKVDLTRITMLLALVCSMPLALFAIAGAEDILEIGQFSAETEGQHIPPGWKLQTFKSIPKTTTYSLVKDAGSVVVRAESRASYAALVKNVRIDPRQYRIIKWRWKTSAVYDKGNETRKDGDDYSARLYVIFEYQPEKLSAWERLQFQAARLLYGEYPPTSAINYIWANRSPVGSIIPNAYSSRSMMVVVESGKHRLGTWLEEQRNIYEDYLQAFRQEPPMITAIAIANDSDNTGESSISYFGDIVLRKR
jgi:hypothetical protein